MSYCLDILGANNMRYSEVHTVTEHFNLACFSKYIYFLNHMCYSRMIHMLMFNLVLVLLL